MKLSAIAAAIAAPMPPDVADREIDALCSPAEATENDIVFLSSPKYREWVEASRAGVVIVKEGVSFTGKICLSVADPYVGYARVAQLFEDCSPLFGEGVASTACVDPTARVHETVSIGPGTVIGARVTIDARCRIGANCVIERDVAIDTDSRIDSGAIIRWKCVLGKRVIVQSGAVIGSDGFGNALQDGVFVRIPAFGVVILEDDVDIGANTTVDRGNFDPTLIGKGVKIDNLVQVAHNVSIGENSAVAAQAGISGSTHIGKKVIIAGQAGFVGHIEIGDGAFVGAQSGVSKGVIPGAKVTGYPARDFMTMRRIDAAQQALPQLIKDVKKLKRRVESLTDGKN